MSNGITSKAYFLTLSLICYAQMFALLAFSTVVLFLNVNGEITTDTSMIGIFQFVVPISIIVFLSMGYFVFKIALSKIEKLSPLSIKLRKYQGAVIVRSALVEVSGLFATVAALITGELLFLAGTALIVIILILLRPTLYNLVEDLSLTPEEKSKMENPNEIVAERQTADS